MRAAPAALALALLLVPACSSAGGPRPVVRPDVLQALLVTGRDVELPGYAITTPAGEHDSRSSTAIRYFTAANGFRQLTVTLVATANAAAARAASSTAVVTALDSLRNARSTAVPVGQDGRHLLGRTKGYGALQDSVFFVEGAVAVSVTLSSSTPDQPTGVAAGVARAQDARLRRA